MPTARTPIPSLFFMRIDEAIRWGRQQLGEMPTTAGDVRLLLQHTLQVEHAYLVAHGEQRLNSQQEDDFRGLVSAAAAGEPVPYLVGESPFYGLPFVVTPDVLIPRPETELLVEAALAWAQAHNPRRVADIGTGSGCIAVTLAHHLPQVEVVAVDSSEQALAVARQNAARHDVLDRISFFQGNLLEPLSFTPEMIVANLPYIGDTEWTIVDDSVKLHEPAGALRGGADGLTVIRALLAQARAKQPPVCALFLEIGWRQGQAAHTLARSFFPQARINLGLDYAGHDRMIIIDNR